MARPNHPVRFHLILGLLLSFAAAGGLWWLLGAKSSSLAWLVSWLIAVNVVTFAYFGFDKKQAAAKRQRVPEAVLQTLSLAGGSPGALLAMHLFRHKTIKRSFRILFWCIVLLQAAALGWLAKASWGP